MFQAAASILHGIIQGIASGIRAGQSINTHANDTLTGANLSRYGSRSDAAARAAKQLQNELRRPLL